MYVVILVVKTFNNKQLEEIGTILYYIDTNSGMEPNAELIDYGTTEAKNTNEVATIIRTDFTLGKQKEPFDLIKHGGLGWSKESGGWAAYANRCNKERAEYIQKFFSYIQINNISSDTVFKALTKWEKEHFRSGFPWGLPYARIFLGKWRSYSW